MIKTKLRKNNGITLIALVITIIVLLILAGVAIAMLSGQNGILNKAKEAKEKTEEGQKQEETTLADYEIDMHFIANNSKYKCRYGYITGVTMNKEEYKVEDTIQNLLDELPQGSEYQIYDKDDTNEIKDKSTILKNGMILKRNNEKLATVIVFGDFRCSGSISSGNSSDLLDNEHKFYTDSMEEFLKISSDVNHDGYVNDADAEEINKFVTQNESTIDNQSVYASKLKDVVKISDIEIIKSWDVFDMDSLKEDKDEYNTKIYKIELKSDLKNEYTYKNLSDTIRSKNIKDKVEFFDSNEEPILSDGKIKSGDYITVTLSIEREEGKIPENESIILNIN